MESENLVIDASIALKWFHQESDSAEAVMVQDEINRGNIHAGAPDLILYEVANALIRGTKHSAHDASEAIEILTLMNWDLLLPSPSLLAQAIELASTHQKLSVYDATYLVLAKQRGAKLVTADKMLHRIAGSAHALLLQDIIL